MVNNKKTWQPLPRAVRSPPYTVEAPGYEKVDGETIPRRNVKSKDELLKRPEEGVATLYDILKRSSEKFGNAKAVGARKLVRTHGNLILFACVTTLRWSHANTIILMQMR